MEQAMQTSVLLRAARSSATRAVLPGLVLLAACLALTGCASTAPRSIAEDAASPPISVSYPRVLKGFTFVSELADDDPVVGTRLGYSSQLLGQLTLHSFVYLIGFSADPEPVLTDFEDGFPSYMQAAKDQGAYDDFKLIENGRLQVEYPFGPRQGIWYRFTVTKGGLESNSLTYLFYRAPFAIKIRATHPLGISGDLLRQHIDVFAEQLLPQLSIRNARDCSADVTIEVDPEGPAEALLAAILESRLYRAQLGCEDYDQLVATLPSSPTASDDSIESRPEESQ